LSSSAARDSISPEALPNIAKRPTFMVHRINAELARIGNPLFRRLGVDLITSRILVVLLERGSAYVGDVVELMSLPQSTVSHQIKRLESAGLVARQADKSDNRAFIVSLTRKGTGVAEQCNLMSQAIYDEVFADVDTKRMAMLSSELENMVAKLKMVSSFNLDI